MHTRFDIIRLIFGFTVFLLHCGHENVRFPVEPDWRCRQARTIETLAEAGNLVEIRKYLAETKNDKGKREALLHVGIKHVTITRELLEAGYSARQLTFRDPPIHWLLIKSPPRWKEILQILVKAGADVNQPGEYGRTPLERALLENRSRAEANTPAQFQALLDLGARPSENLFSELAFQVSHSRMRGYPGPPDARSTESIQEAKDLLQLLFARGWKLPRESFRTALAHADPDAVRFLLPHAGQLMPNDRLAAGVVFGEEKMVKEALRAGAAINDGHFVTPLMVALREKHFKLAVALLNLGADPNKVACAGAHDFFSPVSFAIEYGRLDLLQELAKAGAKLSRVQCEFLTHDYLQQSVGQGDYPIFEFLLKSGIKPDFQDKAIHLHHHRGFDFMEAAVHTGNPRFVERLLEFGGVLKPVQKVKLAVIKGDTDALSKAAAELPEGWVKEQNPENQHTSPHVDLIIFCAYRKRQESARHLLERWGKKLRAADFYAVASAAVDLNDPNLLRMTLKGFDQSDESLGEPLLFSAVSRRQDVLARVFIDAGALVNFANQYGYSILLKALSNDDFALAYLLLEKGADPNYGNSSPTLNEVVRSGLPDQDVIPMISTLIKHGVGPQWIKDSDGDSPLHAAAYFNKPSRMRVLAQHGIGVNLLNKAGETPLHTAIRQGHAAAALELVRLGANPDIADCSGVTARDLAGELQPPVEIPPRR